MMPLPWNVYALNYNRALDLAKRLDLNGGTHIEPSPLVSIFFEDRNEAFAFVVSQWGPYELSRYDDGHVTVVSTPVENLPEVEEWLKHWCAKPWLTTEWVRVRFCSDFEQHEFEEAICVPPSCQNLPLRIGEGRSCQINS
jgi:hypothetical protein